MTWRERRLPASFRGVAFEVEGDDAEVGRRGTTHEYPGRDLPYREDTGRAARVYSISAFLIGADYLDRLDALLVAVEAPGPGSLVHPWLGTLSVSVDGPCRVSHRADEGGCCLVSLSFVESGELRYPTRGRDTASALQGQADALAAEAGAALARGYDLSGPDFVAAGSLSRVDAVLGVLGTAMEAIDQALMEPFRAVQSAAGELLGPGGDVGRFAAGVVGLWHQIEDVSAAPLKLQAQLKGMIAMTGLPGLRPLGLWQSQSEPARRVVGNQNAVAAYLRQSLLSEVVRRVATLPAVSPQQSAERPAVDAREGESAVVALSHRELLELRDRLGVVFDAEALRAADDAMFLALEAARVAAHADLAQRASQAPRLVTRTPPEVLPAVVLAARWQDDASRADELVVRNGITHPGFVPVQPLKLLA